MMIWVDLYLKIILVIGRFIYGNCLDYGLVRMWKLILLLDNLLKGVVMVIDLFVYGNRQGCKLICI